MLSNYFSRKFTLELLIKVVNILRKYTNAMLTENDDVVYFRRSTDDDLSLKKNDYVVLT
jgi:hypothetical protein